MCLYCDQPNARGADTCERHWLGPIEAVRIRHLSRLVEILNQYPGGVLYANSRSPFLGWTIRVADQPVANVIMYVQDARSRHSRTSALGWEAVAKHPRGKYLDGLLKLLRGGPNRLKLAYGFRDFLLESALAQAEHGV